MGIIMNNIDLFIELLDSDMTDEEVYYERLKQCLHQEKMFIQDAREFKKIMITLEIIFLI